MAKWDLYNSNFENTGIIIDEGDKIEDGYYHSSTNSWIINSKKELLLIRKTLNYNLHYPGFWSSIDSNVLSGECGIDSAIKSINDRIGINIEKKEIVEINKDLRDPYNYIYETYIIKKDIELSKIKFNDEIAVQAKWIDLKELYNMIENGEIAWVLIPRIEKYVIPYMQ